MDVARTALRSAAEGKQPAGASGTASAKISELLASTGPSMDVSGLQKIGANALSKVSEATRDLGEVTRDGFSVSGPISLCVESIFTMCCWCCALPLSFWTGML